MGLGIDNTITADSSDILKNKTISALDNLLSDLGLASFSTGVIKTSLTAAIPAHDSIPTAKIVKDELAAKAPLSHTLDVANPHSVTKAQVGLGSVDDTSDVDKPVSSATQAELDLKETIAGAKKQAIKMAIVLG